MRGVLAPFLAVTLLVAGCGGSETSSTPTTEPIESATTSAPTPAGTPVPPSTGTGSASTRPEVPTTRGESPPPTEAPPPTTSVDQTIDELAALRPDGLGHVDFGTPADETVLELTALLGPPDRVEVLEPIGPGEDGCVELGSWLDCLRERRVVDEGRLAVWDRWGLEVALVDTTADYGPAERAAPQFADWRATVAPGDSRLVTVEGLYPGMTVRELRQAVPGVEFGYNEGLLDSVFVAAGEPGWYWGRLDWDPSTDDIEYFDVSAIQAALNEHGANLVVDGEWGSRSEAAWLKFLTDHGFEAFTLQPWLMPEIGEALGLPPGDITIAALGPRPATETVAASLPVLRADGLDRFDFGEPAEDLVSELEALLGPASNDSSITPDGPGRFEYLPGGFHAAYELRTVTWFAPNLQIVLSDVPYRGDRYDPPTPGVLTLMTWVTESPRFRLNSGVGVGSTVAELKAHHPDVRFGTYSVCEDPYDPASFAWPWLHGTFDWDWVSGLQRALNERGAELAVDGEYGPRTAAVVEALQQDLGLDGGIGRIGPETVDALGLEASDSARITLLLGGSRGTC